MFGVRRDLGPILIEVQTGVRCGCLRRGAHKNVGCYRCPHPSPAALGPVYDAVKRRLGATEDHRVWKKVAAGITAGLVGQLVPRAPADPECIPSKGRPSKQAYFMIGDPPYICLPPLPTTPFHRLGNPQTEFSSTALEAVFTERFLSREIIAENIRN